MREEVTKAKEIMLKAETVKEVALMKELQLVKDSEAYDKLVKGQEREMQNLKDQMAREVKRREDLVEAHHAEIQKFQI